MNDAQKFVIKTQWTSNCYLIMSPKIRDRNKHKSIDNMDYAVSFLYDNPETGFAAEWEPRYGPIQVWHKCEPTADNAKPHYFYDFTDSGGGNWSQISVERSGLHEYFYSSNWQAIFMILKEWTDRTA